MFLMRSTLRHYLTMIKIYCCFKWYTYICIAIVTAFLFLFWGYHRGCGKFCTHCANTIALRLAFWTKPGTGRSWKLLKFFTRMSLTKSGSQTHRNSWPNKQNDAWCQGRSTSFSMTWKSEETKQAGIWFVSYEFCPTWETWRCYNFLSNVDEREVSDTCVSDCASNEELSFQPDNDNDNHKQNWQTNREVALASYKTIATALMVSRLLEISWTKRNNLQLSPSNSGKCFRSLSAISSDSKDSLSRPFQTGCRGWGASYKERG